MSSLRLAQLSAFIAFGCATSAPRERLPSPRPAPPASRQVQELELGRDQVVLVARWTNPLRNLNTFGERSYGAFDWRQSLGRLARGAEEAIALEAPVDVVFAVHGAQSGTPEGLSVVAMSVRSAAAMARFAGLNGLKSQTRADGSQEFVGSDFSCALQTAPNSALLRAVCGRSQEATRALARYAGQELPREALSAADVHAELRLEPLRRNFAGRLHQLSGPVAAALLDIQSRNEKFDRVLGRLVSEISGELSAIVNDVERIELDVSLGRDESGLQTNLVARLRQTTSFSARTLMATANKTGAPEAFWRSPIDANHAFFVRNFAAERFEPMKQLLGGLFGELLSYQGTPPKLRDAAAELVRGLPLPKGDLCFASGSIPIDSAVLDKLGLEKGDLERKRSSLGWQIATVNERVDAYKTYLLGLSSAFEDAVLGPQLRRLLAAADYDVPLKLRARPPAPGSALPKGSMALEVGLPARVLDPRTGKLIPSKEPGIKAVVLLVPALGGEQTYIGMAGNEKTLASKLLTMRDNTPANSRLSERTDLSELEQAPAIAGGFFSVSSLPNANALSLPNGGRAPIVHTLSADQPQETLRWRAHLPKSALVDLLTLLVGRSAVGSEPPRQ